MARAQNKHSKRRATRVALGGALLMPLLVLGLWVAIHRVPWLGPMLADGARSVVGPAAISKVEDFAYGVQDRWHRMWRKDERPEAYWEVPSSVPSRGPSTAPSTSTSRPSASATLPAAAPFRPQDVAPVHKRWSAPGDGVWVPVEDPRHPGEAPRMYKTLLHPDRNRSWAAVTVVAVDLRQVGVHLVAGRWEPKATEKAGRSYKRTGLIPPRAHGTLMAAFNGGFKLEHGHYGMHVDGVTLVRPRRKVCTIAMTASGRLEIGSWERFKEREQGLVWWRQTPQCMWELGKLHVGLRAGNNTHWGATVDGDTVIRRSAMGVSQDGKVLFVGIGDSTTARAIAVAMEHAGSYEVAQLDVNWSFPKFVTFSQEGGSGELIASPICKGFEIDEADFVRKPYARDFFYLTRKSAEEIGTAMVEAP